MGGDAAIPVIDLSSFLAEPDSDDARRSVKEIGRACEAVGFFVVAEHGVGEDGVRAMCDVTRRFFELSEADKLAVAFAEGGYRPASSGSLARTAGAVTPPDLCETFGYHPRPGGEAPAVFPDVPEEMKSVWHTWFESMEHLAARLLVAFARALDLPDGWFEPYFEHHSSSLIANYYPTPTRAPLDGQLRRGAHTDFGALTILHQTDDNGGLQVREPAHGRWLQVPYMPGTFVINIGDLMERWTNRRWVSTLHRVVNPELDQMEAPLLRPTRMSLPFFHRPDPESTIRVIETCVGPGEKPSFPPVVAGEWMAAKQRLIY